MKKYYKDDLCEDINYYIDEQMKDPNFKKAYEARELKRQMVDLLISARLNEHLTQGELAEKIGTTQSNISRFESGTYNPTLEFIQRIINALGKRIFINIV